MPWNLVCDPGFNEVITKQQSSGSYQNEMNRKIQSKTVGIL